MFAAAKSRGRRRRKANRRAASLGMIRSNSNAVKPVDKGKDASEGELIQAPKEILSGIETEGKRTKKDKTEIEAVEDARR